ncbi:hypothetical protein A2V61_00515 [Candidatus Woesebacteria bacterium RBG_19FT_COMBO_47_8]|uniref:EfeO-type cupredoxin-like domain-containing protein n=1 Tax=Candidatus Woesebacteria bacterium RBG_13_46_13 TaxID=1802479 RepID=A0A1F7X764_9BACT|nr:MAG: hypothetical protein A2Y68_01675 [Candidatus Woesebacteria bacterium RBG_13_46_13]OGM18297.1 MAG: hypothetical protein A2V61_00515 [Candidatus Woesebacteria bacterium RBG_19FT_COMBO_47_8]HJX59293.1 cupredoxin domain-containing protein [Patescibacteria group bacterium]
MKKTVFITFGILLALLLAAYFIMSRGKTTSSTTSGPSGVSTPSSETGAGSQEPFREVSIVASEYSFTPSVITVKKGERVRLTFKNSGRFPHNFTIEGMGVTTKTLAAGEVDAVEFTASQVGTFSFYCSVDGHKDLGMDGTLEVR